MAKRNLDTLYQRVVTSNNRLRQFEEMHAPEVVMHNERRMLDAAVSGLLEDGEIADAVKHMGAETFLAYLGHIYGARVTPGDPNPARNTDSTNRC